MSNQANMGEENPIEPNEVKTRPAREARLINSLTFLAVTFFLAVWITLFLIVKDSLPVSSEGNSLFTDLTCLSFFAGLIVSIGLGALAGSLLRRVAWKLPGHRRNAR